MVIHKEQILGLRVHNYYSDEGWEPDFEYNEISFRFNKKCDTIVRGLIGSQIKESTVYCD